MKIVEQKDKSTIRSAAEVLMSGGILIFPTDTVYGIGCLLNTDAIKRLYSIKNRPFTQPTAVLMIEADIPEKLKHKFLKYPKGQVTIIANKNNYDLEFPNIVLQNQKVGVRVPSDDWLQQLLVLVGPIIATSANLTGEPTPQKFSDISNDLLEQASFVIKSDFVSQKKPSTVLDIESNKTIRS